VSARGASDPDGWMVSANGVTCALGYGEPLKGWVAYLGAMDLRPDCLRGGTTITSKENVRSSHSSRQSR